MRMMGVVGLWALTVEGGARGRADCSQRQPGRFAMFCASALRQRMLTLTLGLLVCAHL